MTWEPTRHGGFRRTGVAQEDASASAQARTPGQSAALTQQRSVARIHPPVLIFRWHEKLGLPECPYLIRWRLEFPVGSFRVHHWLGPDDDRAFHDHPWFFITLCIKGGYTDKSPAGDNHLHAGSIRYRHALHRHTVIPDPGGAWTIMITGRRTRAWGFWLGGLKFVKANKWFLTRGHHPCQ
jgi:hypothetical protein